MFTLNSLRRLTSKPLTRFLKQRDFLLRHRDDYETAYKGFEWPQLTHFNWGSDYFRHIAHNNHRLALWIINGESETKISFDMMERRSNQVAHFLTKKNVRPFDKILLMLPNIPSLWETTLAAIKMPAVIIPTSTLLTREEIFYRIREGNIQHVITSAANKHKFDQSPFPINRILVDDHAAGWHSYDESLHCPEFFQAPIASKATDPLLQYFTSGTTAKPKLVTHTHESYPVGHLSTMYWLGVKPGSAHLNISTAGWGKHAWSSFFGPWNAEATVVSYGHERFDIKNLMAMLTKHPIDSLCAPPTVWRLMRQESSHHKIHLKQGLSAGEPLNPDVMTDIKNKFGFTIREGYGQTETTALVGYCCNQTILPGSLGHPLPGYQIVVVASEGNEVEEGELAVVRKPRPVGLMHSYSDAAKTEAVMRDGLYRTGDVVRRHEQTLFFVGRSDDVFKGNGSYRISPFELESALASHPAILEAAVVPSPDTTKGLVPKAFFVLRTGFAESPELIQEIIDFLKTKLAPSHMIHKFEVCAELPKTTSGKIRRVELKEKEANACANPPAKRGP